MKTFKNIDWELAGFLAALTSGLAAFGSLIVVIITNGSY